MTVATLHKLSEYRHQLLKFGSGMKEEMDAAGNKEWSEFAVSIMHLAMKMGPSIDAESEKVIG